MEDFNVRDGRDDRPVFIHSELDDYGLSCVEFRVYARLARRSGSGAAFESVPRMAADFEVSDRTVQRALRVLVRSQLVAERPRDGKPTLYTLNPRSAWLPKAQLQAIRDDVANKAKPEAGGDTTAGGVEKGAGVTPRTGVGVTPQPDEGSPPEGTTEGEDGARAAFLPPWLDPKVWARWVAHRAEINHPLTLQTVKAQLKKLEDFRARGMPPAEVIEQSIAGGWQGLFELKKRGNGNSAKSQPARAGRQTYNERTDAALRELYQLE